MYVKIEIKIMKNTPRKFCFSPVKDSIFHTTRVATYVRLHASDRANAYLLLREGTIAGYKPTITTYREEKRREKKVGYNQRHYVEEREERIPRHYMCMRGGTGY